MVWSEAVQPHNSATVGWATAEALLVGLLPSQRSEPNMARFLCYTQSVWRCVEQARLSYLGYHMLDIQLCFCCKLCVKKGFFFPHGDSHPLDVGLGRAVDLPRICFYALAVEKRESIPMLSPRDGQALAQALKVNRTLQMLRLDDNSIGSAGAQAPGWKGSPMGWMVKFVGKKEACGRCFRPVCLGAFLVRYVWLLECHWNLLNSFTAGNICTTWFSHKWCKLGGTLQVVIVWYLNDTPPIEQPRGLLIQGWHYIIIECVFVGWCFDYSPMPKLCQEGSGKTRGKTLAMKHLGDFELKTVVLHSLVPRYEKPRCASVFSREHCTLDS